jgi:hypothetical protein
LPNWSASAPGPGRGAPSRRSAWKSLTGKLDLRRGIAARRRRVGRAETSAHRIAEALDHRSRQINQTLIERTREIAETFTSGQTGFASLIDDRLVEVGPSHRHIESLAEMMTERANAATDSLPPRARTSPHRARGRVRVTQRLINESGKPPAPCAPRPLKPPRCSVAPSTRRSIFGARPRRHRCARTAPRD